MGDRLIPAWIRRRIGQVLGLPPDQARRDFLLRSIPRGSVGAEIGVHEGDFSRRILDIVQPKRLFLIDPWRYEAAPRYRRSLYGGEAGGSQAAMDRRCQAVLARFTVEIGAGQVVVLRAPSDEAMARLEDDALDFVYIDGNHLYEFVRRDLGLSALKVRQGGLICGDDYGQGGWWRGGVKRAVDEFVAGGRAKTMLIRRDQFILENLKKSIN